MLITLTDKDFGVQAFLPSQIARISFNLPDRLGVSVLVVNLPEHIHGLDIVPVNPDEVKEMFQKLASTWA